jgi:hypothetical protein
MPRSANTPFACVCGRRKRKSRHCEAFAFAPKPWQARQIRVRARALTSAVRRAPRLRRLPNGASPFPDCHHGRFSAAQRARRTSMRRVRAAAATRCRLAVPRGCNARSAQRGSSAMCQPYCCAAFSLLRYVLPCRSRSPARRRSRSPERRRRSRSRSRSRGRRSPPRDSYRSGGGGGGGYRGGGGGYGGGGGGYGGDARGPPPQRPRYSPPRGASTLYATSTSNVVRLNGLPYNVTPGAPALLAPLHPASFI